MRRTVALVYGLVGWLVLAVAGTATAVLMPWWLWLGMVHRIRLVAEFAGRLEYSARRMDNTGNFGGLALNMIAPGPKVLGWLDERRRAFDMGQYVLVSGLWLLLPAWVTTVALSALVYSGEVQAQALAACVQLLVGWAAIIMVCASVFGVLAISARKRLRERDSARRALDELLPPPL